MIRRQSWIETSGICIRHKSVVLTPMQVLTTFSPVMSESSVLDTNRQACMYHGVYKQNSVEKNYTKSN